MGSKCNPRVSSIPNKSIDLAMKIVWCTSLLYLACVGSAAPQCTVESSTFSANIEGEVLVLSVESLQYNNARYGPSSSSSAACAAACGSLPSCNAWTFCNKPTGCGGGCSSWVAKYPKLPAGNPANRDPVNADLPILGFGPWTYPLEQNGCQFSSSTGNTSDAWPYGLCTLKRVADTQRVQFYPPHLTAVQKKIAAGIVTESASSATSAASADGWVSGTLSVSYDCQGLPANVCKQCSETKDPSACVKCAKDQRAQYSKKPVNYLINKGNRAQATCAVCANLGDAANRSRCVSCILGGKSCATCVYGARMWGPGQPNIGACLRCVAKKGDQYAGACNACAQSQHPKRCFACLDTYPLKICNGSSPIGTSGCRVGPNDQTPCDLCSNSAISDGVFQQCLQCHKSSPLYGAQDCLDCGNYPTSAANQARCYQCVQTARAPVNAQVTGCASCFSSWLLPGAAQQCLQCVESSTTPHAAKASCASCLDGTAQRSPAKQKQCLACLKNTQIKDYEGTCLDTSRKRLLTVWR